MAISHASNEFASRHFTISSMNHASPQHFEENKVYDPLIYAASLSEFAETEHAISEFVVTFIKHLVDSSFAKSLPL